MIDKNNRNRDKRGGASSSGSETAQAPERIAKRLARAGVASRREAESLIADGRVKVNGKVLDSPAVNVSAQDRIEIDGEPIPAIERTRLFLFHKPAGVVTTNRDPEGRRTVFDVLPEGLPRLVTIGRLDINTEGLLLLTNDGGLARVLELPQTGWLRRYRVRVHGEVDEAALAGLKDGIAVDGVFYGAIEAALDRKQGTNAWLTVGLREGKNREVKNVMTALGLEVTRLIRISYGPFQLAELEEGQVRELRGRMLRDQLGPRLIEEAGANFDAPIVTPFPGNQESRPETRPEPRESGRDRPRQPRGEREEAGGLIRKRDRNERRGDALARLSTKAPPGRGPKRDDKRGGDERQRAPEVRRSRSSNVWMAPGARPQSSKASSKDGDEKTVTVPRKPGDRKAKHDAMAKRLRPGRAERAAGQETSERPRREWKPRPEGDERPKRDFKPRSDAPKRNWKDKPPRPGKAERASGEGGRSYEYKPRPKEDGEARPPRRPRPEGSERRDQGREGRPSDTRERKPFAKRDGETASRPPRSFSGKPGGKPGGRPGARPGGRPFGGKPSGGKPRGPKGGA